MQNINIFSYGTLQKSKFSKNREVKDATLVGPFEIMEGNFPLLKDVGIGKNVIKGKFFKVSKAEIDEIDDYEELPHLFKREEKSITLDDSTKQSAWVYLLNE